MSEHSAIVIGREFGSGGREIAEWVAKELGFNYYDRELLAESAQRHGFSASLFAARDERRPSALRSLLHFGYGVSDTYNSSTLSSEALYKVQSEVIRALSDEANCVFVGRTADYVLRDNPDLLSVFIHAPLEYRIQRIIERGDAADERQAAELAKRMDRKRADYYNYFTGRTWGAAYNYDLSFDASRWSTDKIAHYIAKLLEEHYLA